MAIDKNTPTDDFGEIEGIDVSQLSEQEKAIYDKLNAQVRKAYLDKTSKLAAQRKQWEGDMDKIKAEHTEAVQALQAWQQWYEREGQYMTPRQQKQAMEDEGLENPNALQSEIQALKREFSEANKSYQQIVQDLRQELGTTRQALTLSTQINDLRFKHPEIDPMRILETAKERNITDMDLAYQLAYGDELRTKQVNDEVEKRVAEERTKMESERNVIDTTPSTTRYAPPPEAKSYSEASANLLSDVRKGGGSGLVS